MQKIGLILANPGTNYGAHLQAYATQYAIDNLGVETEVVECLSTPVRGHYYMDLGLVVDLYHSICKKFLKKNRKPTYDKAFQLNKKERVKLAKQFRNERLHDFRNFNDYKSLVEGVRNYDAILIGSDQLWLPGTSLGPINSLRFVPKGVRRISYATSLGVSEYPRYCWNSARDMWMNMDSISVREQQGADIIRNVCNNKKEVEVVLDPTYLLSKEQWEDAIPVKRMAEKDYVFCYFLGDDKKSKESAKRFAQEHNLHLVSILSCESYSDIDRTFADQTIGAVSPEDFINWIRGAQYVFTDSFHGLAFSVINHKQFFVYYRKRKDSSHSRNSRIDNILSLWQCEDRAIPNPEIDWKDINYSPINYEQVEKIVSKERTASLNFLKKALGVHED